MRKKIVISHWVHDDVRDFLADRFEVVANATLDSWPGPVLRDYCADADALIGFMPDSVDDAFLARCPRLRVIAGALKGYDNFDVGACTRRGIWLTIVPDLLTAPTAELPVGLMIGLGRKVLSGDRWVRGGKFPGWRPRYYGIGLAGSVVGILGAGALGCAIARRLDGFDARLLYHDISPLSPDEERTLDLTRAPLETLLATSDFVVTALPLTADTQHLLDAERLALIRPDALLVNIGRGSVVDESAVARALDTGKLAGYAADVFEFEDWLRPDRPKGIVPGLLSHVERTLFTGHMGSAVVQARHDIAMYAARSVVQALDGRRPSGAVNEIEPHRAAI